MGYNYVPIIWPLLLSALTTLFLGVFVLVKHSKARGTDYFAISMFLVTIWSLTNALEMAATELSVKLFWANVQYIAYCLSPVTLLGLCLEVIGHHIKPIKKRLIRLLIIPSVTLLLVCTSRWHGLIRYNVHMDYAGEYQFIAKTYGTWFYIHAVYSYLLNFTAIIVLVRAIFSQAIHLRKRRWRKLTQN